MSPNTQSHVITQNYPNDDVKFPVSNMDPNPNLSNPKVLPISKRSYFNTKSPPPAVSKPIFDNTNLINNNTINDNEISTPKIQFYEDDELFLSTPHGGGDYRDNDPDQDLENNDDGDDIKEEYDTLERGLAKRIQEIFQDQNYEENHQLQQWEDQYSDNENEQTEEPDRIEFQFNKQAIGEADNMFYDISPSTNSFQYGDSINNYWNESSTKYDNNNYSARNSETKQKDFNKTQYSPLDLSKLSPIKDYANIIKGNSKDSKKYQIPKSNAKKLKQFIERQDHQMKKSQMKINVAQTQLQKARCTFRPKVDPVSALIVKQNQDPLGSSRKVKPQQIFENLYQKAVQKQKEKEDKIKETLLVKQQQEAQQCTFKPNVSFSAVAGTWKYQSKGISPYQQVESTSPGGFDSERLYERNLKWKNDSSFILQRERERKADLEYKECTFQPNIGNRDKSAENCPILPMQNQIFHQPKTQIKTYREEQIIEKQICPSKNEVQKQNKSVQIYVQRQNQARQIKDQALLINKKYKGDNWTGQVTKARPFSFSTDKKNKEQEKIKNDQTPQQDKIDTPENAYTEADSQVNELSKMAGKYQDINQSVGQISHIQNKSFDLKNSKSNMLFKDAMESLHSELHSIKFGNSDDDN